jgi:hypothetical protein
MTHLRFHQNTKLGVFGSGGRPPVSRWRQGQALRVLRNLDPAGRGRAIKPAGSEGMPFLPHQGNKLLSLFFGGPGQGVLLLFVALKKLERITVPRYYFHFSDGKRTFTDSIGVELTGIAAARSQVTAQIHEMRGALSERILQDWLGWTMIAVDAKGKTLFEIGFDLIPRSLN